MDDSFVAISGGSSGIGKALAAECLGPGRTVIIGARREGLVREAVDELSAGAGSRRIHGFPLDIADRKSIGAFRLEVSRLTATSSTSPRWPG